MKIGDGVLIFYWCSELKITGESMMTRYHMLLFIQVLAALSDLMVPQRGESGANGLSSRI